jgi:hypothetical protein
MKALVWSVATHGCKTWTLKKEEETRIQTFKNECIRKLLRTSRMKRMTNEQVYKLTRTENQLLGHIKSRKLSYFGHVVRQPHDTVDGGVRTGLAEDVRRAWKTDNMLV